MASFRVNPTADTIYKRLSKGEDKNSNEFEFYLSGFLYLFICFILISCSYKVGKNTVYKENVQHKLMYFSPSKNQYFWEKDFLLIGIDKVEKREK